jgi:phospholipid transport system substrate-binding protein
MPAFRKASCARPIAAIMRRDGNGDFRARWAPAETSRTDRNITVRFSLALFVRQAVLISTLALGASLPAQAATPAEALVSDNIQKGLLILNDGHLSSGERSAHFESFLLGVTDLKRVSSFVLGRYGKSASQADRDAFANAFQRYAVAVYQSYLGRYAGQTLTVTGSRQNAPGDDIVTTSFNDPDRSGRPLEIAFRVRSDGASPKIVDFSVAGIWLALEERDQFTAFLGQNGGSIAGLTAHLDILRANLSTAG